jgi:magnesium chelatase subunit D
MQAAPDPRARWQDALLAARLVAACGHGIGGIHLVAGNGPVRDLWLDTLKQLCAGRPFVAMPCASSPDRICGGIDLQATLAQGRLMVEKGLLARADGGIVIIPGAERLDASANAPLCVALDTGIVPAAATGDPFPAGISVVAIDEAAEGESGLGEALAGRLAIRLKLDDISWLAISRDKPSIAVEPKLDCASVTISDAMIETIMRATPVLCPRRILLTVSLAKAIAALERRPSSTLRDVLTALRLADPDAAPLEQPEDRETAAQEQQAPQDAPEPHSDAERNATAETPSELDVAIKAADISGISLDMAPSRAAARLPGARGKSGERRKKARRGRVTGLHERPPFPDARPDIAATLRAAAPWQPIRRAERKAQGLPDTGRVILRATDFRYRHYEDKRETAVIFAVDASGSTAFDRLGEAKGAVELLLADCYAKRHHVGLVAFRGETAETLLPPTRSLIRAKRCLEALPGGGATPLAAGLRRATELAAAARAKGQTPLMVFLSDGSGNIALDGTAGRQKAGEDAMSTARIAAALSLNCLFIDIGRRGSNRGRPLAEALNAEYCPLPFVSARGMSILVQAQLEAQRG